MYLHEYIVLCMVLKVYEAEESKGSTGYWIAVFTDFKSESSVLFYVTPFFVYFVNFGFFGRSKRIKEIELLVFPKILYGLAQGLLC